jgi:hypothetical protein
VDESFTHGGGLESDLRSEAISVGAFDGPIPRAVREPTVLRRLEGLWFLRWRRFAPGQHEISLASLVSLAFVIVKFRQVEFLEPGIRRIEAADLCGQIEQVFWKAEEDADETIGRANHARRVRRGA